MAQQNLIQINGPVGNLETLYLPAQGAERGVAVINHPNPTQGGTFTNKVIQTAAKCLAQMGLHCYLPNLRRHRQQRRAIQRRHRRNRRLHRRD